MEEKRASVVMSFSKDLIFKKGPSLYVINGRY